MHTRTICCKLVITPSIAAALKETSERFADACNYVLKVAMAEKTSHAIKLHQLCYAKINKGCAWYIHMVVEMKEEPASGDGVMGVDLGLNNIATTSTGLRIEEQDRQDFKKKRAKVRASLQSKGSPGAKKVLKKLSGYEKRRMKHENHVLSRQLIEEARRHNCGLIRMEQLKDIRSKTKTWNKHLNRMVAGWSFYELQQFVQYKASVVGISVEFVNPAYTSQTCRHCLKLGSRKGERFYCLTCGEEHADVNASHVIALGGAVCKPARINAHKGS